MSLSRLRTPALVGLLATAGGAHLAAPRSFDAIIPPWLPGRPRAWTYGSGLAELACAVGIAIPASRRTAATATAGLFVAVFPGNVQMLLDARSPRATAIAAARLPLQVPLVLWAWRVRREA